MADESRLSTKWLLWTVPSWIAAVAILALLLGVAPLTDIGTLLVLVLILVFWIGLDLSDKLFIQNRALVELVEILKEREKDRAHEKGYGQK